MFKKALLCQGFKHSPYKHIAVFLQSTIYRTLILAVNEEPMEAGKRSTRDPHFTSPTLLLQKPCKSLFCKAVSKDTAISKANLSYERMLLFLVTTYLQLTEPPNQINILHIIQTLNSLHYDVPY